MVENLPTINEDELVDPVKIGLDQSGISNRTENYDSL